MAQAHTDFDDSGAGNVFGPCRLFREADEQNFASRGSAYGRRVPAEDGGHTGKDRTHQPHPSEKGCKGYDQVSGGLPPGGCGGLPMLL